MTTTATTRAAIYSRVSSFMQKAKGYGLQAQDEDCARAVSRLGVTVRDEHRWTDDESGADWDLPGLNDMLDAAKRGDFDVLIVPEPDRLARNMAKQLTIEEELRRSGVVIHYARFNLEDTAEGRLLKNQLASFAEYEREKIAFRTARGRWQKAKHGLVVGSGPPPTGYRYTHNADGKVQGLEPDPASAPIVQRIFADAARMSVEDVRRGLDADGIPVRFAGKRGTKGWGRSTILAILRNPVYTGCAVYGRRRRTDKRRVMRPESEWITASVPPLVTPEEAQAAFAGIARRRVQGRARNPETDAYELRGRLVCGHCGGQISVWNRTDRARAYCCLRAFPSAAERQHAAPCRLPVLRAELIEAALWGRVVATLTKPQHLADGLAAARELHAAEHEQRAGRLDTLDKEIARLRAKLARITSERLDCERGSEAERALLAAARETETTIGRFTAERAELAARPTPGLTAEDALALEAFAAEVRAGVEAAQKADRRRIYELLRLRVRVFEDAEGELLARGHRYRLECDAIISVSGVSGDQTFKSMCLSFTLPGEGVRLTPAPVERHALAA